MCRSRAFAGPDPQTCAHSETLCRSVYADGGGGSVAIQGVEVEAQEPALPAFRSPP